MIKQWWAMEECRRKLFYIIYSSLAQLAEHAAVNRRVVGSSPTGREKTVCGSVFDLPIKPKYGVGSFITTVNFDKAIEVSV